MDRGGDQNSSSRRVSRVGGGVGGGGGVGSGGANEIVCGCCYSPDLRNYQFKISTFDPRRDGIDESDDGIQVQSVGQWDSGGSIIRQRDVHITGRQRGWGRRLWIWLTEKKWHRGTKDPNHHGEATTATTMM